MASDRLILGENAIYSLDSTETLLNCNVLVVGGSGSEKTMSVLEPRLLETFNSSLIVLLAKKRLCKKYEPLFKERGYHVASLDFTDLSHSRYCYDPLQYVCSYQDVSFLAESIVQANPRKEHSTAADPYWDQSATLLLSALITLTLMQKEDATFEDVLKLFDSIDFCEQNGLIVTSLDEKFDSLREKDPHCFAVTCWNAFKMLPIKTAGCVFSTLHTALDTFSPELRRNISKGKSLDFEQIASEKSVVFITTSAVNPSLHFLANMLCAQAIKQLFEYAESRRSGVLPIPVHFLFDDFAVGAQIHGFERHISIMREKGLSATLLLQSEHQLRAMYGADAAEIIIDNADSYVYLGGMDLHTAHSISERLNAPLDEVLYMPIGQEVIFRRGQKPLKTQRYNVFENELYKAVTQQYQQEINEYEI